MNAQLRTYNKWLGLLGIIPALAMIFTDQSILPVALPSIQQHLGASNNELQWSVNAYALVIAVMVLTCGKIGDRIGYRTSFCIGVALFAFSSLLCALSQSGIDLMAARALQGLGAALLLPASSPLLMSLFPPEERGKASGINMSIGSLFLILGPLIGGYLTETLSWRWIFWVNLPLAVWCLALVPFVIPPHPPKEGHIDLWGFLAFALASSSFVIFLMNGREWGWTSSITLGWGLSFIVGAFLLLWRETHAEHPFLDLSLFQHPHFRAICLCVFSAGFILMITVFWAIYFQEALHYTPLQSGTLTFFSSLPVFVMAPVAGYLTDRSLAKLSIAIGFLLLIFSFFWMSYFNTDTLPFLLPGLLSLGMGVPLISTPSASSVTRTVPVHKWGTAYGTLSTLRSLGASLGIATIGASIEQIEDWTFRRTEVGASLSSEAAERLISGVETARTASLQEALTQSLEAGFRYTNLILAFLLVFALAMVFLFYNRKVEES